MDGTAGRARGMGHSDFLGLVGLWWTFVRTAEGRGRVGVDTAVVVGCNGSVI
jgi:hypothetical protein